MKCESESGKEDNPMGGGALSRLLLGQKACFPRESSFPREVCGAGVSRSAPVPSGAGGAPRA